MNRRAFFGLAASAAAAFALDPERALWVPGAKTISIPATTRPYLAVGDVVTFGNIRQRYIVTAAAHSLTEIARARFRQISPRLAYSKSDFRWISNQRVITRIEQLGPPRMTGDTVSPTFAAFQQLSGERDWQTLSPDLLLRL